MNTTTATRGPRAPSEQQIQTLQVWRTRALARMPYLASMLFSLRVLDAPGLGTLAVDAHWRLYVDFEAPMVAAFSPDEGGQALLHECSHLMARHAEQAAMLAITPDQQATFGAACDLSINDDLRDGGCAMFADTGSFLLPSKYGLPDHRTPGYYFDELTKQIAARRPHRGGGQDAGGGAEGPSSPGDGQGEPFDGCGSGSGGPSAPCELPADDDMGGAAPAITVAERERVEIAVAASIAQHATQGRGTVPAGMSEWAQQVMTPSVTPWQQVLASHVRRSAAAKSGPFDADPSRRHRRRHRQQITDGAGSVRGTVVVPGTYSPDLTAEVIRDTSGSMSARDLGLVTREVEAIARRLGIRGDALRVTDVDAAVESSTGYKGRASIAQARGRGGTDMRVGIQAACERRPRPAVVVVMTDGYTPWPTAKPVVPVVVALVAAPAAFEAVRARVPEWAKVVCITATP